MFSFHILEEEVKRMALRLDHLHKRFGKHVALKNLSLEIPEKEIFGFLGGNGAGKTTTFRMILGLIEPTQGNIYWNNETVTDKIKQDIGYLPEERGLYPKLTVKDQMIYFGRLKGQTKQESLQSLTYWLDRLKVPHYLNKKVQELSKGNQQKIQFITAVLHKPKLLILDEPFSGLDPVNVELLKEAIIDLKNVGTSIVFSSHQMSHVEELCEHLCILQEGHAVVQGDLTSIKQSFGKKNLVIHADFPLDDLKEFSQVVSYKEIARGCELQITSKEAAEEIFNSLHQRGFVQKFVIEEPTLNDIFIEKAGASYE